ncbi:hypothetical protein HN680_00230, partial [Candidatus Peregrinibacteria bacterium]|nr:hypothetical protein [Candidatus Peregrinibacteria bacterium]
MRLNPPRIMIRLMGLTIASAGLFLMMGVAIASAAPIIVDTLVDNNDTGVDCGSMVIGDLPGTDTNVSLREAICVANNDGVGSVVAFSVSGQISFSDPAGTPQIEDDGTFLIDGGGNIELDGQSGAADCFGTDEEVSTVSGVTIKGLTFQNFGTDGALCVSGSNWLIGGPNVADRNFFYGTTSDIGTAVFMRGNGHMFRNNYVGLQSDGTTKTAMRNGIALRAGSTNNTIKDNYIANGAGCGIKYLNGAGSSTTIGNKIGVRTDGSSSASSVGICDEAGGSYSGLVTIGGGDVATRNIISGLTGNGIDLRGTYSGGVVIQGNFMGTTINGNGARPNSKGGLILANCTAVQCVIGGTTEGARNVISGNAGSGLRFGNGASNWAVKKNFIGLNVAGDTAVPNGADGIYITDSAALVIGDSGHRNIISGNIGRGIRIIDAIGAIGISGNNIGTNPAGMVAIPNGMAGIYVQGGSANITIGAPDAIAPANIISGNLASGFRVKNTLGGAVNFFSTIDGLNADESGVIPNGQQGVKIDGENGNLAVITIGNTLTTGYNVIAGNASEVGVLSNIKIDDGSSATLRGNYIGTNSSGTFIPPHAGKDGLLIIGDNVAVGGTTVGQGNVFAGASGNIESESVGQIAIRPPAA